jgi:hypothetical protein
MKYNTKSSPIVIRFFILLAFALCELPAFAQLPFTLWTGAGDGSSWFDDLNWNPIGKPTISTNVRINNGAKVQISGGSASARSITLGLAAQDSGTLQVMAGGSLVLPSYTSSGAFPVEGAIYIGYYGRGTLSITNGGTVTSSVGWIAALRDPEARTPSNGLVMVDGTGSKWTLNGEGSNVRLCVGGIGSGISGIDGGTGLLSITNGGLVYSSTSGIPAGWVGISGTLTGNNIFAAGAGNFNGRLFLVNGTLAPSKSLRIDANLNLSPPATTVCDVTPQDVNIVNLAVAGTAILHGRLQVTMTGSGFTPGARFTLLHAGDGLFNQTTFDGGISITYRCLPCISSLFTPVIQYDHAGGNVYLYLEPENPQ